MDAVARALLARSRPMLLERRMQEEWSREARLGCDPTVARAPVALEPALPEDPPLTKSAPVAAPLRWRIWLPEAEEAAEWHLSETFLKQLSGAQFRLGFEVSGNHEEIRFCYLCEGSDAVSLQAAFAGVFPTCRLTAADCFLPGELDVRQGLFFADYYPAPPLSGLFTSYEELRESPLGSLVQILKRLPGSVSGFYQCLFVPCRADWHGRVERLRDLEFTLKLQHGAELGLRGYSQQMPSGDLRQSSFEVERKAHNDRPFFTVAVRLGVAGADADRNMLRALQAFLHVFQYGGRPLRWVDGSGYTSVLSPTRLEELFVSGLVWRPGFLLNSRELTGLVHRVPLAALRSVPLPMRNSLIPEESLSGARIGESRDGESVIPVCLPDLYREQGTHIIGRSGSGKTTVMLQLLLEDLRRGVGACFIDPHGDGVQDILRRLPPEARERCIYFDPGDQQHIPLWNPLARDSEECRFRLADDLLAAFRRVFQDWGDRLAHVLRHGLIGLSYLDNPCLLDLYHLLRQKSPQGERIRESILAREGLEAPVRTFWERDFLKDYREGELAAPKHKLSKLLAGSVYLMLSQPQSRIRLRDIMEDGRILLVDLSRVGAETRQVLGSLLLTLLMMAALGRSSQAAESRVPFSIFADECHLFVSADAIEQLIVQARKFRVRLTIAHQYLAQFQSRRVEALSTAGITIVGRVNKDDARFFSKDMRDLAGVHDFLALEPFEFIARNGTEIVKFRSQPLDPGDDSAAAEVVASSRNTYCATTAELRARLDSPAAPAPAAALPSVDLNAFGFTEEDFGYEEL